MWLQVKYRLPFQKERRVESSLGDRLRWEQWLGKELESELCENPSKEHSGLIVPSMHWKANPINPNEPLTVTLGFRAYT